MEKRNIINTVALLFIIVVIVPAGCVHPIFDLEIHNTSNKSVRLQITNWLTGIDTIIEAGNARPVKVYTTHFSSKRSSGTMFPEISFVASENGRSNTKVLYLNKDDKSNFKCDWYSCNGIITIDEKLNIKIENKPNK